MCSKRVEIYPVAECGCMELAEGHERTAKNLPKRYIQILVVLFGSPKQPCLDLDSSATVDLKAASSSAMASSGVLHPNVFLGRWFISRATSNSSV